MLADGLAERLAARLTRGRAAAVARMTSRAVVMRKTGRTTQSETNGREVPEWAAVHVDVPFRLVGGTTAGETRTVTVGGVELQLAVRRGDFPASLTDFADGDLIEITAGENTWSVWRIVEADWADQQTARRVPVVTTDRPAEWG